MTYIEAPPFDQTTAIILAMAQRADNFATIRDIASTYLITDPPAAIIKHGPPSDIDLLLVAVCGPPMGSSYKPAFTYDGVGYSGLNDFLISWYATYADEPVRMATVLTQCQTPGTPLWHAFQRSAPHYARKDIHGLTSWFGQHKKNYSFPLVLTHAGYGRKKFWWVECQPQKAAPNSPKPGTVPQHPKAAPRPK